MRFKFADKALKNKILPDN